MILPKILKKKIVLGSVNFGSVYGINHKKLKFQEVRKILSHARLNDLKYIDTAQLYTSEEIIAKYRKHRFKIITKILFNSKHKSFEKTKRIVSKSILKIKCHILDTVMFHDTKILHTKSGEQIYKNLNKLKEKGYFNKIGVSIYDFSELKFLLNKYKFDVIQCPFNVLDKRIIDENWLNILKKKKTEVHARSIFLQGLILNKNFRKDKDYFNNANKTFKDFELFIKKNQISALECALNYVIKNKNIDKVIIGIDNLKQFKQILNSYLKKNINFEFKMKKLEEKFYNPSKWPANIKVKYEKKK